MINIKYQSPMHKDAIYQLRKKKLEITPRRLQIQVRMSVQTKRNLRGNKLSNVVHGKF